MKRDLPLESETCWFLLFATLDYVMTYTLLYVSVFIDRPIVEANPFAAPLYDSFGEYGLLAWRLGMAFITLAGVQYVAMHRLDLARKLLWFGVAAGVCLVAYQGSLLLIATGAVRAPEIETLLTIGG